MKRKRFSVEQIVAVLKQVELGMPVGDVIRQTGICEQTFYRWEKQYAGLEPDQAREYRQLEAIGVRSCYLQENNRSHPLKGLCQESKFFR